MATVYERVKSVVVDNLRVDEDAVQEHSSFADDLKADSLDLVELIMAFEEEFSTKDNPIGIPDDVAKDIDTVGQAVAYLKEHGVKDERESDAVPA